MHDGIMPAIGSTRAQLAGEPVSRFNLADEEREMRDRIWRFLVAPHANDWFYDTVVELQRTRIASLADHRFEPARYYRWLRQTGFSSSTTRYRAISDHIVADLGTLPATFRTICRVVELDRQRKLASVGLGGRQADDVQARHLENQSHIAWFVRAARYRYEAYRLALDNLLVETPHQEAVKVDAELTALAIAVDRAERGDFCSRMQPVEFAAETALPSRLLIRGEEAKDYRK